MSSRAQILSKIETVPSIPSSVARAVQLLQNENAEISEIVPMIEHDPGLTANLLRLCNSVHLRGRGEVDSLQDAIVRIGTCRTLELALTHAIAPLANGTVEGYDLPPGQLWVHSVGVAIGAERLARELGLDAPASTFTGALLHDLGKIVLGTFVDVDATSILELACRDSIPFEEAERKVLGIDHAEVGAILLESWNLPCSVVDIVRWHHRPEHTTGNQRAVDLVHAANLMILESGLGGGIDGLKCRPSPAVASRLQLTNRILETALCHVLDDLVKIRTLFGN